MRARFLWSVRLILLSVLLGIAPLPTSTATAPAAPNPAQAQLIVPPVVPIYQEPQYPALPSLALELSSAPLTVSPGMTSTLTLVVTNRSETPATKVVVQLPLPKGMQLAAPIRGDAAIIAPLPKVSSSLVSGIDVPNPRIISDARDATGGDDQLSGPAKEPVQPLVLPADPAPLTPPDPIKVPSLPDDATDPATAGQLVRGAGALVTVAPGDPQWVIDTLPGQSQATVTLTVKIDAQPAESAIPVTASASAAELRETAQATGGVLVIAPKLEATSTRTSPDATAGLHSADGRVSLIFPPKASDRPLTIRQTRLVDALADGSLRERAPPSGGPFGHPDLGVFLLTATDDAGQDMHRFTAPLTLTVGYTPAQLQAAQLREGDLTLAWFNKDSGRWEPVPTTVDPLTHTATATIDHFTPWTLSNGLSPSALFVPSLQSFQVSQFTGAASYSYPLEAPAGPGGMKPNLSLSYSSAGSDGPGGLREKWQAGWVGKGWNLSAGGSVSRVRSPVGPYWDNYTFSFGGKSYDIVRGAQLSGTPGDMNETLWSWVAVDEADFLRVRAVDAGGGLIVWEVWTKDGSRYDFTQPLYATDVQSRYIYQWLLTRVTDTHGNRMDYFYTVDDVQQGDHFQPTFYLSEIRWGYDGAMGLDNYQHASATGNARYRVVFQTGSRWAAPTAGVDTLWEYPTGYQSVTVHEAYRLNRVTVQSWRSGATGYETIREYALEYYGSTQSVFSDSSAGQRVLTLQRIAQVGRDGGQLPWTTFTYGTTMGTWPYTAGWNRLSTATNGQGGQVTYSYEHVFGASTDYKQANYHRVTQILRQDTSGQSYSRSALTTYTYGSAALNDHDHSLKVWYAHYPPAGYGDSRSLLSHPENNELRGHQWVQARDYDGATTAATQLRMVQTSFIQGDPGNGCTPTVTGGIIDTTTACYTLMAQRELWKGLPWDVRTYSPAGALLSETTTTYNYQFLDFFGLSNYSASTGYPRTGLWRQFVPERVRQEGVVEGYSAPQLGKTVATCYQESAQGGTQYGNATHVLEYEGLVTIDPATQLTNCDQPTTSAAPTRITRTWFAHAEDWNYYLSAQPTQVAIFAATATQLLALTENFYDGNNTTYGAIGSRGLLTATRSYKNVTGSPFYSRDASFGYDQWGNQTTQSTYSAWSWRTISGSTPSYGPLGNGSAARTTTTDYDSTFHAFPIRQTNPLSQVERADYDYRMGTLTKVGGPNVADQATFDGWSCATADVQKEITCAGYDQFGRMTSLVKPGDTTGAATLYAYYYDTETPFRYLIQQRGTSTSGDYLFETELFYDGMGRQIQTKRESAGGGAQMIVTDTSYDALGRTVATSQPRYDTTLWSAFVPQSSPLYRATTTTYDALGRPLTITAPDLTVTQHIYKADAANQRLWSSTIDAKRHLTRQVTDGLGRLRTAIENIGDCGYWGMSCLTAPYTTPYDEYARATYTYDAQDRLTQVQDAAGNLTTLGYDALGEKTSMTDPDMGSWTYAYDQNGNLTSQVDARSITTSFGYDALNRLTGKTYSNGDLARNYTYDETAAGNGKGHRTSTCVWNGSTCTISQRWIYDGRGRTTYSAQNANGVVQELSTGYDSGDRQTSMTYGGTGAEVVTYGYDAAGRQVSLSSTVGGYVTSATYTALDQPSQRNLSSGAVQTWGYTSPLARLNSVSVTGTGSTTLLNQSYGYDNVGNITSIADSWLGQTQTFTYDHRDRLLTGVTSGSATGAYNQSYSYDTIGNLLTKGTSALSYPSAGSARPHTPTSAGGQLMAYDADGNLITDGSRWYSWNAENQPTLITTASTPATEWAATSLSHLVGRADADGWSANTAQDSVGYLAYGPYTTSFGANDYLATWQLMVDNNTADNATVVTLDVHDATSNTVLASRTVTRKQFGATYQYQGFTLPFTIDSAHAGHQLQFRVLWNDTSYVRLQKVGIRGRSNGVNETYAYDADGGRATRTRAGVTTTYALGVYEQEGAIARKYYTFAGQPIAVRDSGTGLSYLHSDHLGSASLVTTSAGAQSSWQRFDPWGSVRATSSGGVTQTKRNFTGQYLDDTGLLFYNARYYDPVLGRFISADTVVPGNASGGMGGIQLKPLTVSFSEPGFVAKLNQENQLGPWFALSGKEQQQLGSPMGPQNPQSLNRYSYTLNNPMRWTDPSGHERVTTPDGTASYEEICSRGDRLMSCAPGETPVTDEKGNILYQTCIGSKLDECEYTYGGNSNFDNFKGSVDKANSDRTNAYIWLGVMVVDGVITVGTLCGGLAGCLIGTGGVIFAEGMAAMYYEDEQRETRNAHMYFWRIRENNAKYNKKYP